MKRAVLGLALSLAVTVAAAAEPAPPLTVTTLAGAPFDLASLKGHGVIVNFWATWCVPCRAEMPMLNEFYRRHHGDGVDLIGVSVDNARDLDKVRKIAAGLSYPIALARDASRNGFPPVNALPLTYVIDAQGRVAALLTPDEKGLSEQQLLAALQLK